LKPSEEGKEDRWVLLRKSRRILYLIENNVVQPKKNENIIHEIDKYTEKSFRYIRI